MFRRVCPPMLRGVLSGWVVVQWVVALAAAAPDGVRFNRDIRPLLADNCFSCHGSDAGHRKGKLRLDTVEGATQTNAAGRVALKPGQIAASEVWQRINSADPEQVMPPPDTGRTLTPDQRGKLRQWIESGARYEPHWSFTAPVKAPLPAGIAGNHPVDRFVTARLAAEHLVPAPEADRWTLIRRLSFDLTGLPPTPTEVDAFVRDGAPDAYDRLVDRLLRSPHYGEQLARHWLDVARYADTHGMHLDNERQMWPYRDWVVGAFNRNLPFDQFTIEQLAGDLLPEPTVGQLIATGFNRCNVTTGEGGSIDAECLFRYAVDRTSTVAQAWLGLTAGCAMCHDHKFDPISTKEFYSLYAFFNSAADPAMDGNILRTAPTVQIKRAEDESRLAEFATRLGTAESRVKAAVAGVAYVDPAEQQPRPPARDESVIWLDEGIPTGFKTDSNPTWVDVAHGVVFAGAKALQREGKGVVQDVFEATGEGFTLGLNARFFVQVYLDPANPPRTIMLQWNRDNWEHRAVWGEADGVPWGEKGQPSRAIIGPLPATGRWVRLEVAAETVGLRAGDRVKAFACTQMDGRVTWDQLGATGRVDPAADPRHSFAAWRQRYEGKEPGELPEEVRRIFKNTKPTERTAAQVQQLREHFLTRVHAGSRSVFDPLLQDVAKVRQERTAFEDGIPHSLVWRDLEKPRESFVMQRGQYDRPGEKVTRDVPAAFPPLHAAGTNASRLDLARWLVSAEHPLTSRVFVNRIWLQFFGVGLVKTTEDFGTQGQAPSHPELLDWLAVEFRETGWDVKRLVRLLVTSAAYRQSSRVTPELWQRDPENRLLARGPRFRLEAEQIRDQALFVAGLMDLTPGGRGVKPYQPPNIWEPVGFVGSNTRDYRQDMGAALYRRSLYTFFKRTAPPPFMAAFDAPNREQSCTRRERSNTPLQALQLLNDVQYVEAARHLAQRMLTVGGGTREQRLRFGFRLVLAREPDARELQTLSGALERHLIRYEREPAAAEKLLAFGDSRTRADLPASELAAYTLTANLLLNLDETVTRN